MDFLIGLYGCTFLLGVLGNGILGLTLCCGPGAKSRSPLLFGLILADFLVCSLSAPATAATYMVGAWAPAWRQAAQLVQSWPVAASTLLMMTLSVDRYLTIKNYRPMRQVSRRRSLLTSVVVALWLLAGCLAGSQLLEAPWRRSVAITRVFLVYIVPSCVVLVSHLGVHAKLTALSLTARAKHGELPLPMPLLRRPTHVIIVASMYKDNKEASEASAAEEDLETPPTSTLRSRRRLARALLWIAIIFALCWTPYVVGQFCVEFGVSFPEVVQRYTLLIGHVHSALSPVLYWSLNLQWPQCPCRIRLPALHKSASSTNEAALGPFHPKLIRPPPIRRQSSHYLY